MAIAPYRKRWCLIGKMDKLISAAKTAPSSARFGDFRDRIGGERVKDDRLDGGSALERAAVASPRKVSVLGVGVSVIDLPKAVEIIDNWVCEDRRDYVCVTGMHGVMASWRDDPVRHIHNAAGLVTPDGMPLVWLLRWYGCREVDRVYGPDLMLTLFDHGRGLGYRHFLYGSTSATLERLESNLTSLFPGAHIVGRIAPPFRRLTEAEEESIVAAINESGADIVWVGLSTPRQEVWMATYRARLAAKVLIGVGAAFDFHAGTKKQAPRFIQRNGFEWLFRIAMEPRRLWRRYLANIPIFIGLVALQMLGLRHYPLDRDAKL
jgi:N-acetylglucosaminyldiphosphoundecaprenol N-acetyl-beta-D-mannosaminyltransferase